MWSDSLVSSRMESLPRIPDQRRKSRLGDGSFGSFAVDCQSALQLPPSVALAEASSNTAHMEPPLPAINLQHEGPAFHLWIPRAFQRTTQHAESRRPVISKHPGPYKHLTHQQLVQPSITTKRPDLPKSSGGRAEASPDMKLTILHTMRSSSCPGQNARMRKAMVLQGPGGRMTTLHAGSKAQDHGAPRNHGL